MLSAFLDSTQIHFVDIPKTFCGIILSNGNIIINQKYYDDLKDNSKSVESLSAILTTLLHKLAQVLPRLANKKYGNDDNFHIKTEETTIGKDTFTEPGDVFDFYYTGILNDISLTPARYILTLSNYQRKNFHIEFDKIHSDSLVKYPSKPQVEELPRYPRGRCLWSLMRQPKEAK